MRSAVRSLRRRPAFALAAILTVALAVGANTALFGVIYQVLIQPLPFRDAARLVRIWEARDYDLQHVDRWPTAARGSGWAGRVPRGAGGQRTQPIAGGCRTTRGSALYSLWGVPEYLPRLPPCWRSHLRHDLSRADRKRAYATSDWHQGVQAPVVRFVTVRSVHKRLSGEDRSASSSSAKPSQRDRGASHIGEGADHVSGMALGDASSSDLCDGWLDHAQGPPNPLRTRACGIEA